MRSGVKRAVILASAGVLAVSQANAAVYTWIAAGPGGSSSQWGQHKNWSGGPGNTTPTSTADTATFTGTAPTTLAGVPATTIGSAIVTSGNYNLNGLLVNNLSLSGGGLSGGTYTVYTDFTDSNWAITGNTFNPKVDAASATINAGGTNSQLVTLWDSSTVSNGNSVSLDLGTLMLGQTLTFTFDHTQATGLTLHEALQTPDFAGVLSLKHGPTTVNQLTGELQAYSASATESYTISADNPGSFSGTLSFVSNYSNLAPITISISGSVDPVPEPSSVILIGLAGFYAATRRRQHA